MSRTLALTGSTGFIGAALLRELIRAGWKVQALHRHPLSRFRSDAGDGAVEWVRGSLEDSESLVRLVRGAEAVVHCAGAIRGATADDFRKVNVEGVMRLAAASQKSHPRPRVLLISSLAAREPQLSHYAASKRAGEDALRSAAAGMSWTALRPPAVYGPGDRETLPLVRCMQRGFAPVLGQTDARFSLLFVEDLADAVRHLLESAQWSEVPFEIHDGQTGGYTWEELTQTVSRITGRPVRRCSIPGWLMQTAARSNLWLSQGIGYAPMLTPGKVRELTHPKGVCNDAALRRVTGWGPRFQLEAGMRRTIEHLRNGRRMAER
jgi:nucleoside-diphosphate-sugar epimerase